MVNQDLLWMSDLFVCSIQYKTPFEALCLSKCIEGRHWQCRVCGWKEFYATKIRGVLSNEYDFIARHLASEDHTLSALSNDYESRN